MILGYILICGMGPMEPYAIEGCIAYTEQFAQLTECENEAIGFLNKPELSEGQYIDGFDCIVIGAGA
tara:strand:+ start:284 stop:484 length:201 start_codon:yes stop_codon:yes gene_type:complete